MANRSIGCEMPENDWLSGVRSATLDSIGQVYFATPLGVRSAKPTAGSPQS